MFSSDQFVVEPVIEPGLSADRKRTIKRQQMIANGIHPATKVKLRGDNETCGSCTHSVKADDRWWKCDLVLMTGGPGTDIRVGWPACEKWKGKE